jgi:pimeloyl-ACP methyl ester carboxylesterase
MKSWRFAVSLLLLAAVLLTGLSAMGAAPAGAAPPEPSVHWSPCHRDTGYPFECGFVQVPLDYAHPGRATISIALVRLPAADPEQRIGSLFLNPGGPGGSGVDFALAIAPIYRSTVLGARFDIVGFDPRGIARSTALRCFGTPRQWTGYFTPFPYPTTDEEEAVWETADLYVVDACERRAGRIIDHMSTADTARDLDLLRQAVGDEMLTYTGYSYGTYLGVTYANLFPDRVRAVVVDAVLDPIAWSTGAPGQGDTIPFTTRLRSDEGARDTLNQFFLLCDAGGTNCPFAPNSAARFAALYDSLLANPIVVILPDGSTFTFSHADLINNALGAMYNSFSWPSFAELLVAIESMAGPQQIGLRLHALWLDEGLITKRGMPAYPNYVEGFPGVGCSDSDNPHTYAAWSAAADDAEANYGYFGRLWTWLSSICAAWPGAQDSRYTGPFTANTANPVLVAGTLYDPATRYQGALTVHGLLPNSSLLTVNGWGHGTLFLSQCADQIVTDYLVYGTVPPEGTVCYQDWVPFAGGIQALVVRGKAERQRAIPAMVPDIVREQVLTDH